MAVVAALVLIGRSAGSDEQKPYELKGSTTRGEPVTLKVEEGRVERFDIRVGVSCPQQKVWHGWDWAGHGPFGGEGERFEFGDRNRFPDGGRFISVMRGRLIDDGSRARGTIDTRGTWPGKDGPSPCRSSLRFEAAKTG